MLKTQFWESFGFDGIGSGIIQTPLNSDTESLFSVNKRFDMLDTFSTVQMLIKNKFRKYLEDVRQHKQESLQRENSIIVTMWGGG